MQCLGDNYSVELQKNQAAKPTLNSRASSFWFSMSTHGSKAKQSDYICANGQHSRTAAKKHSILKKKKFFKPKYTFNINEPNM